jgi:hypothetical protein
MARILVSLNWMWRFQFKLCSAMTYFSTRAEGNTELGLNGRPGLSNADLPTLTGDAVYTGCFKANIVATSILPNVLV